MLTKCDRQTDLCGCLPRPLPHFTARQNFPQEPDSIHCLKKRNFAKRKRPLPILTGSPIACFNGYMFKTWITTILGGWGLKGSLSLRSSNRRPVNSSGSGNVVFLGGNHPPRPIQSSQPKPIPSNPPTRYHFLHTSLPNNLSTSSKGVVLSECEAPNQCICNDIFVSPTIILLKQTTFIRVFELFLIIRWKLQVQAPPTPLYGQLV